MVSIYNSSPDKVLYALERVDKELWQHSVGDSFTYNLQRSGASILQQLRMYAKDYHYAKSIAQFADASELYEPYIQLVDSWIENTASYHNLTREVLKAKVNIMLGRIAQEDKKIHRIRTGLGAVSILCTISIGFNIHQSIGVEKQKELVEQQLAKVNIDYYQVYSKVLKSFPVKKSKGFLGFAKSVVGYQDPPPDKLSQLEIPPHPIPEQKELLDQLKDIQQTRKQFLDASNYLNNKQSKIFIWIAFSSILLIFIPLHGWIWIPTHRILSK
ncbi:MAG: hypothetical protein IGS39_03965 [Calothrix sp. C42_A2020_038]|nr:hypothetical protein [Calothrix sp. C42_A2020_038]